MFPKSGKSSIMINNELISVIMPAFNAERLISAAIASVIAQTYSNWELIVVDDGSTDSTAEIVKEMANLDPRIHYIYQPNTKQAKARNTGIAHSSGNFIAFLDADDLWLKDKLSILVQAFDTNRYDLIFSDSYTFKDHLDLDKLTPAQERFNVPEAEYSGKKGLEQFLFQNKIPILTVLVKKEIILHVGGFNDVSPCEDYDLWLRLLIEGYRFKALDVPLTAYRFHSTSATAADTLAVSCCINALQKLSNAASNPYQPIFLKYLNVWYARRMDQIFEPKEFKALINKIVDHGHASLFLKLSALFNFRKLLRFNKKLALYLLK